MAISGDIFHCHSLVRCYQHLGSRDRRCLASVKSKTPPLQGNYPVQDANTSEVEKPTLLFFFFFWPYGLWDISSPVKDRTQAPAIKESLEQPGLLFSLQRTIGILGEACLLDLPSREPRTSLSATWGSPLDPD